MYIQLFLHKEILSYYLISEVLKDILSTCVKPLSLYVDFHFKIIYR